MLETSVTALPLWVYGATCWLLLCSAHGLAVAAADPQVCGHEAEFMAARAIRTRQIVADNPFVPKPPIEAIPFSMPDGVVLMGYRVQASGDLAVPVEARGFVLMLLGDGLPAQQALPLATLLAPAGLDVFVVDYRGFGSSGGQASIAASIQDSIELVSQLSGGSRATLPKYVQRYIYGISAGAAIALNSLSKTDLRIDALIVDGLPPRLSHHVLWLSRLECPENMEPINLLDTRLSLRTLMVIGDDDTPLRWTQSRADREALPVVACHAGAVVIRFKEFAHPFQDKFLRERADLARQFFRPDARLPIGTAGKITQVAGWGTKGTTISATACP